MLFDTLNRSAETVRWLDRRYIATDAPPQAGAGLLLDFVRRLDDASVPYCILHGFEEMPARWQSDIDLCVGGGDLHLALELLETSAERTGWAICNLLEHEQCAFGAVLAKQSADGHVDVVIFDICSDYRFNGLLYIDASVMLAGRWTSNGLSVAAPAVELAYLLAKRTLKRSCSHEHAEHLVDLYQQDPEGADRLIRRLWGAPAAETLIGDLRSTSPAIASRVLKMRRDLRRRAFDRTWRERPRAIPLEFIRLALRSLRPIGLVIAVLGPDGAGKTTLITGLDEQLTPLFRQSVRIHLRPRLFGVPDGGGAPVTDPHGLPNRSTFASIVKLCLYAGEHAMAHMVRIRPQLVRGRLVLYDRIFDDIRVDPRRYRYGGPLRLISSLGNVIPSPNCVIVLDAPVEVLHARKQEVTAAEAERQRTGYRRLADATPNCVVIDASRTAEHILADASGHLLRCMHERVEERTRSIGGRLWTIAG